MIRSIRFRLLALVLSGFILVWTAVGAFSWWHTSVEIHEILDSQLAQIARLIAVITVHESEEKDLAGFETDLLQQGYEYPVVFQVWSAGGSLLVRGPDAPYVALSGSVEDGYTDESFKGKEWRVFTLHTRDREHRVQVAHDLGIRNALLREFVFDVLKPLLLALPLLGLVWLGIERGLAPLRWVAGQVSDRSHASLEPMVTNAVPVEISGLVDAINALFSRLQESFDRNSRFTADAAHELRTPLAGAITQVYAAMQAQTDAERRHALGQVLAGLQRLNRLIEQLLILARIEPAQAHRSFSPVDLNALATEVLSELTPKALHKGVDVELQAVRPISVTGSAELLAVMIGNLVENAIRATPAGGKISVSLDSTADGINLVIEDTGPGIPAEDKERVFDRFHRLADTPGHGAGLGLSIVRAVAGLHKATVSRVDREGDHGLRAIVRFSP